MIISNKKFTSSIGFVDNTLKRTYLPVVYTREEAISIMKSKKPSLTNLIETFDLE
jgi:hypothetical protein